MAKWIEYDAEDQAGYQEWLKQAPPDVRARIEELGLHPDVLFRMKSTDQRVFVSGFAADGKVTVVILHRYNTHLKDRPPLDFKVFGVDPHDLVECDLPDGIEIIRREPRPQPRVH